MGGRGKKGQNVKRGGGIIKYGGVLKLAIVESSADPGVENLTKAQKFSPKESSAAQIFSPDYSLTLDLYKKVAPFY